MEQLVARRAHNPKVISSSLVPATKELDVKSSSKKLKLHCGMEQLVARRAHNPKVISSSLVPATEEALRKLGALFF